MALSAQRRIQPSLNPDLASAMDFPIAATQVIYKGALVALNSAGDMVPAAATAGLRAVGVADTGSDASINTTGLSAGDKSCLARQGIWPFKIGSAGDALTKAHVGRDVYMIDDETVGLTDGTTGRGIAGQLVKVSGSLAYVAIGFRLIPGDSNERLKSAPEALSASGAISVVIPTTLLTVSGTLAMTLADGLYVGQRKRIHCVTAGSTPHGVVTPAHPSGFSTLDFTTARGTADVEWTGAAWVIVGIGGTVAIA